MSLLKGTRYPLLGIKKFRPSDIPQCEADALIDLYRYGGGDNWTNNTGWLIDRVVGNWHGTTVINGHVTDIVLTNNNCSGNISKFNMSKLSFLEEIRLNSNPLSGNITNWEYPDTLNYIRINNCSFTGNIDAIPASMNNFFVNNNFLSGDATGWIVTPTMANFQLYSNSFFGVPNVSSNISFRTYRYENCGLFQSDVDAVILSIYNRRAAFTFATPELNISGTNSTPSGIYQDATPPTTGKEHIFKLENDPDTEGFNTWSITYTL